MTLLKGKSGIASDLTPTDNYPLGPITPLPFPPPIVTLDLADHKEGHDDFVGTIHKLAGSLSQGLSARPPCQMLIIERSDDGLITRPRDHGLTTRPWADYPTMA